MKAFTAFPSYIVHSVSNGIKETRTFQCQEDAIDHGKKMTDLGFTVSITVKATLMGWNNEEEEI